MTVIGVVTTNDERRKMVGRALEFEIEAGRSGAHPDKRTDALTRPEVIEDVRAKRLHICLAGGGERAVQAGNVGPACGILGFRAPVLVEPVPHRTRQFAAIVEVEVILVLNRSVSTNRKVDAGRITGTVGPVCSGNIGKGAQSACNQ